MITKTEVFLADELSKMRAENRRLTEENAKLRARAIAAEKAVNERGSGFIALGGDVRMLSGDYPALNAKIEPWEPPSSHWTGPMGDLHPFVFYDGQWWGSNDSLQERKRQNGEVE